MTAYQIQYDPKFWHEQEDGQSIDRELLGRVTALANFLLSNDMVVGNIRFTEGVRSRQRAHKMSTSYFLCRKPSPISLENLRALPGGKDLDGNQWYDPAWDSVFQPWGMPPDSFEDLRRLQQFNLDEVWEKIRQRARQIKPQNDLAAEGYPISDPRILPNNHDFISNHVGGNAIDCHIEWRPGTVVTKFLDRTFCVSTSRAFAPRPMSDNDPFVQFVVVNGDVHDPAANCIIDYFGLCRPVPHEKWHFQLAANRLPLSVANSRWRH